MAMPTVLTNELLTERLANFNRSLFSPWSIIGGKLHKEFTFSGFVEAVGFIVRVAIVAERMDHHPELLIKSRQVVCDLSTHSAGGITDLDFELAKEIEQLS